jgi:protein PhnA
MWSEHSAVKVMTWRLLKNIEDQAWAADLLSQMYLEDELLEWASTGQGSSQKTVDSNGNQLSDGDTVTLIKDLDVKGANFTAKRGTIVKKIRLTDNPEHIEGKVNGTQIVLVANFLKKV